MTDASEAASAVQSLRCFVIGPIGSRLAAQGSDERLVYEDAVQVLEEVIEPACKAVGLQPVRSDGLSRPGEISEQVFRRLRDDDIVIADLTGANANVMYELGLRHTRNRLTIQIGEYGRLPFDVNVIRTIQFSRSAHGLASARKELIAMLEAGLAGEYDPVSAMRIWGESEGDDGGSGGADSPQDEDGPPPRGPDQPEDAPGFLELLAAAEDASEQLVVASNDISRIIEELGNLASESTAQMEQSDSQGRGMKGRLAVTIQYAERLSGLAIELEDAVARYAESMSAVSSGHLVIIGQLEQDPSQLEAGMEFALVVRRMAQTARESFSGMSSFAMSLEETARAARVLREPIAKIVKALDVYVIATGQADEWDRRLQALGVPIPPDDWEPEFESESHEEDWPPSGSEQES